VTLHYVLTTTVDIADLREVNTKDAKELADKLKVPFIETSAKDEILVEQIFLTLAKLVLFIHIAITIKS
jgi:hypothetical protein